MSLLVDPKNTFEIVLTYKVTEKDIVFVDVGENEKTEGYTVEKFTFRKPNWRDTRIIMASSMTGTTLESIDVLAYTEAKVKTLLVGWSLKDKEGNDIPISRFDQLSPAVILKLSALMDGKLGEAAFGMKQ